MSVISVCFYIADVLCIHVVRKYSNINVLSFNRDVL